MTIRIPKIQILSAVLLLFFIFTFISSADATTFDWVQQEFLKAHNDLRASVVVPPLQWDANLANFAQSWANSRKQDCNYRQHSTSSYGENIYWELYRQTPASGVVQKWFSEKQFFNHATNLCNCQPERERCECGHYLNIIWRTTTKVGCSSFTYCNDQKGVYVVCSYDPIGNVKGVNPLNPGNNVGVTSPNLPPKPLNNGTARYARGRGRGRGRKSRRGRGRRNKRV
ncbi:pathogenesis-related protein PRMS-like [Nicotiana tabacum]|uniref:Pathogenesis-related protein PRMS-like n=1 Tax=Nicotiana tabacum TaxID=4097 RepID=A0AC58U490_TOBAC